MAHPVDVYVGRKIREARAAMKISQQKLGKKLGVSFQQVQKYEKGANRIGTSRLYQISRELGIGDLNWFVEGYEKRGSLQKAPPRRAIELANEIDSIKDPKVKAQLLNLIKACVQAPYRGQKSAKV